MIVIIREPDLQNNKLNTIYNTFIKLTDSNYTLPLVKLQYYKSMFEIDILTPQNISLSDFKSIIHKVDQQCSDKVISIFKLLYPNDYSIKLQQEQFSELVKMFKNIKTNIFYEAPTEDDQNKFQELLNFIKPGSYFIYKYLKIQKSRHINTFDKKKHLHISFANIPININNINSAILYLKAYDHDFNDIINKSKVNTLRFL